MSGRRGSRPRRRARRRVCASASASPSSGMMSLKTMPGLGEVRDVAASRREPSSMTYARADRLRQAPACRRSSRQKRSCESSCASSASVCRSSTAAAAALRVPRAQRRRDERLEQPRLAVGRRAERPQVARRDPEARQPPARVRDLDVRLAVEPLAALDARREQAEVLELARELGRIPARSHSSPRRPRPRAPRARHGAACAAPSRSGESSSWRITRSGRNSSRWSSRIRAQPLDVVLAEEPVAALRAPRRQQPLVLEVADLRDRDVRELGS